MQVITPWPQRYQKIVPRGCNFIRESSSREKGTAFVKGQEEEWIDQPVENRIKSSSFIPKSKEQKHRRRYGNGPLVAFAQGLAEVSTTWVLLLACDLPQLQAREINYWKKQLNSVPEGFIALLPKNGKGWEPVCGFYQSCCLPLLKNYIAQGGRSFQGWLTQHRVQQLSVDDNQVLFNCNTPDDFSLVRRGKGADF
ncbi:MAG: molybdenum cofactor guanylyltransferase [Okeania sp. SIO2D1]|nr:molybdenum cofactor guanylyltransferase [Okeania sp. SIO2D1]